MKIKLAIDATNEVDVLSGITCLAGILKDLHSKELMPSTNEAVIKPIKAVKETPKPAEEIKEAVIGEIKNDTSAEDTIDKVIDHRDKITLQHVREELGKKVTDHRDKIKTKLTELGAKAVGVLDAKHFQEMYEFLKAL